MSENMSDLEISELENTQTQDITERFSRPIQPDMHLQFLITITNETSFTDAGKTKSVGIPITIIVSGKTIAGEMVSFVEYYESFSAEFAEGLFQNDPDGQHRMAEAYMQKVKPYIEYSQSASGSPPRYLHLKNVKFLSDAGSPIPFPPNKIWRIRSDEIQGYMFGRII